MILTGNQIVEDYQKGKISICPFDEKMVNPNSYNYRLGETIYKVNDIIVDPKSKSDIERIDLSEDGYCLLPGCLYLGSTYESIGSAEYSIQLIGRSSIGRLGLFLQISAPLGHIGTDHNWTLELKVVQPLIVYPRMKIGQVSFWKVEGENDIPYLGKYWVYSEAHESEFYRELMQGELLNDPNR